MLSYSDRVYIANPKTLMEQRHLNLDQRAEVIKRERNLPKLSASTVWRVYQEFGEKYIKPKIVYRSKNERQMELQQQQQQFSQIILRTIIHSPHVEIVYIDETTLLQLSKRSQKVNCIVYTERISEQLKLGIEKHNSQYPPIEIRILKNAHDRFLS